jgi:hypothetical protein
VDGSTTALCPSQYLEKSYDVSGNTLTNDLAAYLSFTSTLDEYNFPYVVVYLFDGDNLVGYQVYYGKDVISGIYAGYAAADPANYTELPAASGQFRLNISKIGDSDFTRVVVQLANYACIGQNSVTFDHLTLVNTCDGSQQSEVEACKNYTVDIASASPNPAAPGSGITVDGTLVESGEPTDLSGATIDVNGAPVSVLLNSWSTTVNASGTPGSFGITAAYVSVCNDTFSDTTTVTVEGGGDGGGGEEPQDIKVTTSSVDLGNAGGECSWGFHREGELCVRDALLSPSIADADVGTGLSGPTTNETLPAGDAGNATGDDNTQNGNLLTGAVVGGGIGSLWWLIILCAIIAGMYGYYRWKRA